MATVNDIVTNIAEQVGDADLERVYKDQIIEFINSAARELRAVGLVKPLQDDESVTLATSTFEYAVPSGFAFIHDLFEETSAGSGVYTNWVPWQRWRLKVGLSNQPVIWFDDQLFTVTNGVDIRILGHERPTVSYSLGTTEVDIGFETYITQAAAHNLALQLIQTAARETELSGLTSVADTTARMKEQILSGLLQQPHFRPSPYSRPVPLR